MAVHEPHTLPAVLANPRNQSSWLGQLYSATTFITHLFHGGSIRQPLFDLPESLLREIFEYLSPIDQVCFSFSCKRFFSLFGSVINRKEFRFPRLLHPEVPDSWCLNEPDVLRNKLLIRLEDNRLAFCGYCLKLHPRDEFGQKEKSTLKIPPLQRCCISYGIADLCPCIAITYRDRERIMKFLKGLPTSLYEPVYWGVFTAETDTEGKRYLKHRCWMDFRIKNAARLEMKLFITEYDELVMLSRYSIYLSHTDLTEDYEPIYLCPHVFLFQIRKYYTPTFYCRCGAYIEAYLDTSSHMERLVVNVTRRLGKGEWPPDKGWVKSSRSNW